MDAGKYDRQLRLWSDAGQSALGASHVAVVGATAATLEAAKGLILAGIGSLTLVHGAPAHSSSSSSGSSSSDGDSGGGGTMLFSADASELRRQLQDLNSDAAVAVVARAADVRTGVTLVIESAASRGTHSFDAPVLTVGAHMLTGFVRLTAPDLFVLQPHPEAGLADLRTSRAALAQWPELRAFCDSFDLDALSDTEHAHVPYFVLLVKAHAAGMSLSELRAALARLARSADEENFAEARRNARLAIRAETDVPAGVRALVAFRAAHRAHDAAPFWQLVGALGTYIERHGILPVSGEVPDMISSTESFVALKRIYAARFDADAAELATYLPADAHVAPSLLHAFCRNVRVLKYIYWNDARAPVRQEAEGLGQRADRELYAVASLIGGVAAQEATKIIMHQYMPMLGVLVYDAARGELVAKDTEQYVVIDAESHD